MAIRKVHGSDLEIDTESYIDVSETRWTNEMGSHYLRVGVAGAPAGYTNFRFLNSFEAEKLLATFSQSDIELLGGQAIYAVYKGRRLEGVLKRP